MANLAPACCCLEEISCVDFVQCAPPCLRIPSFTVSHSQRSETSSCTTISRDISVTVKEALFIFDPGTACYFLVDGLVDVAYEERLFGIFGAGGPFGPEFDLGAGECCPACLECCEVSKITFTATDALLTSGITICCVRPCGINGDKQLLRLEFDYPVPGSAQSWTADPSAAPGCCGDLLTDGPLEAGLSVGFRLWTNLTCNVGSWFNCRTLDWYSFDVAGFNGGNFQGGRIPGTTGGSPLNEICAGAYLYERPGCLPDQNGNLTVTTFDCLKAGFGVDRTHYDVTSCELNDRNQPGGTQLLHSFYCVDSRLSGCSFYVSCCSDGTSACTPGPPPLNCPDICCGNTGGVLDFIYRTDKASSRFEQAPLPLNPCPAPKGACCLPEGGGCIRTTEADCTAQGGTYQGDGTICNNWICDL